MSMSIKIETVLGYEIYTDVAKINIDSKGLNFETKDGAYTKDLSTVKSVTISKGKDILTDIPTKPRDIDYGLVKV